MQKYWNEDPNFRHEAAPKPRLTDADYHPIICRKKLALKSACNGRLKNSLSQPKKSHYLMRPMFCVLAKTLSFSMDLPPI